MWTTSSIRRSYLDQAHALAAHVKKGFQHLRDMMILSRQRWSALLRKWYAGFHDVNTQTKTNQSEAKLNSSFSHDKTGVDKAKSSTSPNSRAAVDWKKLFISSKDINYKTYHCNYCHLYQRTCTLTASCADSPMLDYYDHQQHSDYLYSPPWSYWWKSAWYSQSIIMVCNLLVVRQFPRTPQSFGQQEGIPRNNPVTEYNGKD